MSNDQKIAFLCHPYHRGGVTRWMADAALAYAKQGFEVYFITVEPAKDFFSARGRETLLQLLGKEKSTVRVLKVKVGGEFEFGTSEYREFIYRKLIIQLPLGTPVIVSDDETIWQAATFLNDSYPVVGVLHADEDYYYKLAEKYARQVHALACVSLRVHNTVSRRIPWFDAEYIATIPCGINLPPMNLSMERAGKLRLAYVGRVGNYQKRVGDLEKICKVLANRNIPFHLNIIGDGDDQQALHNKFKEAGLGDSVTFCGWLQQREVARHLAESDIIVLTSDFEGTPVAMMEALAWGCGFVGTRVSGVEDYEFHPVAADCFSVFAVGDIEDAANKIERIAAMPVSTRRIAARSLAEAEFGMDICLEKYMSVITAIKPAFIPAPPIILPVNKRLYSRVLAAARALKVRLK